MKTEKMKRSDYTIPTMKVVELKYRTELLIGSSKSRVTAKRTGYGPANDGVANGELNSDGEWEWDD